ncbi:accessory Sec system glycosyltransferase GtfA [Leuconostoc palmae]|uniref:accessory Sec system glycosyltransferase GtfA n=1 Tax=Leuconostoc palmae TaxID=501487 RepID=UPI001C7DF3A8|nr:accessory Sec system glycosyltransferase GtfA [Leuconostoc palmae]
MTVYNFNLALGWASSGVEYAQAYRENVFRQLGINSKFVFAELILNGNIFDMADRIGMDIDNVMPIHFYFTDLKPSKSVFSLDMFEETIDLDDFHKVITADVVTYESEGTFLRVGLDQIHNNIDYIDYVKNGFLIRKDHYTYTKTFSEYYVPVDNRAELFKRTFFNEDGTVAYEQIIDHGDVTYVINSVILYSEFEFVDYFVSQLKLTSSDVLIIDREQYIAPAVFKYKRDAKVGVVIHAEHYSANQTDERHVVWNNFYEYQFTNASEINFFITATKKQKKVLEQQFKHYENIDPKVYAIPVGSLDKLRGKRHRRTENQLMTASRLASEKHVDWIVKAVLKVHETIPNVTLDIFGTGGEVATLETLIKENNAESFIKLKGHQDLTEIYKSYYGYVSASQSEGFGLTLLEAIGSGLPIVGFDVPYGNQEFIDESQNGYLVSYNANIQDNIQSLQSGIKSLLGTSEHTNLKKHSYQKAEYYLSKNIKALWNTLLEEEVGEKNND